MSDQAPVQAQNPVIANATQALAIKELGETVAGVKNTIKKLWISFAVLAVVVVVLAVMTFVPSLRFGLSGRGGTFNRGQFTNGSTTGGAPGGTTNGTTGGTGGNPTVTQP